MGGTLLRSIGVMRARAHIGLRNLAYNMRRLTHLESEASCPGRISGLCWTNSVWRKPQGGSAPSTARAQAVGRGADVQGGPFKHWGIVQSVRPRRSSTRSVDPADVHVRSPWGSGFRISDLCPQCGHIDGVAVPINRGWRLARGSWTELFDMVRSRFIRARGYPGRRVGQIVDASIVEVPRQGQQSRGRTRRSPADRADPGGRSRPQGCSNRLASSWTWTPGGLLKKGGHELLRVQEPRLDGPPVQVGAKSNTTVI